MQILIRSSQANTGFANTGFTISKFQICESGSVLFLENFFWGEGGGFAVRSVVAAKRGRLDKMGLC